MSFGRALGLTLFAIAVASASVGMPGSGRTAHATGTINVVVFGDSLAAWSTLAPSCGDADQPSPPTCPFGWVKSYADGLTAGTSSTVNVANYACGGQTSYGLLETIRQEKYIGCLLTGDLPNLQEDLAAADIVAWDIGLNDWFIARAGPPYGCGSTNTACFNNMVTNFKTNWTAIIAEIRSHNATAPLRTMDMYYAPVNVDVASGRFTSLNGYLTKMNRHIYSTTPSAAIAQVHLAFNGPAGNIDPGVDSALHPRYLLNTVQGFLGGTITDHVHPNLAGAEAIAFEFRGRCAASGDPSALNNDGNFIGLKPTYTADDLTAPSSDYTGDFCDSDDDNDGFPDTFEANPVTCGAFIVTMDPRKLDTDNDGTTDTIECLNGYDPTNGSSKPPLPAVDPDGDQLDVWGEAIAHTCPQIVGGQSSNPYCHVGGDINAPLVANASDTDGDGLLDGWEIRGYATSPTNVDTDGDGVKDGCEAGSFDEDAAINSADAAKLASEILRTPPPAKYADMDIDRDGSVTSQDQTAWGLLYGKC